MKKLLANLFIFKYNIKNIHWRMFGPDFIDIHKFTDKIYAEIDEFIDRVIEKYIQLDQDIDTSIDSQTKLSTLKELTVKEISVEDGIKRIVEEGKEILAQAESLEDKVGDLGTMYLVLDDLREFLEKHIWLLSKQK
ncbi:MAG: hypothetical protein GY679_03475 [Mycoplasma sp.]|nr:hypothetical protein [Mycoplasma sp.]